MNKKRFNFNLTLGEDEHKGLIFDNEKVMKTIDVAYLLNDFYEENQELQEDFNDALNRIEERSIDIQLLKKENEQLKQDLKLQKELREIEIGGNLELQYENEQLKKENKKLKAQLQTDSVCSICIHHYLIEAPVGQRMFYISKCYKGHNKCPKNDINYCKDFELNDGDVE